MAEVVLSKGEIAYVDDEDLDLLAGYKWRAIRKHKCIYAVTNVVVQTKPTRSTPLYMHRLIMNAQANELIDHEDRNGLNNHKSNLRVATNAQNVQNQTKVRRNGAVPKSRYKGVTYLTRSGKWQARISHDGKRHQIGTFCSEVEAAQAYDREARVRFKEFARLNFPEVSDGNGRPEQSALDLLERSPCVEVSGPGGDPARAAEHGAGDGRPAADHGAAEAGDPIVEHGGDPLPGPVPALSAHGWRDG